MKHLFVRTSNSLSLSSIEIQNVSLVDYLLSNNHVNNIILHKFDFSDEEITAYYISFLKTLSLKLNKHSIHFFYNEVRPRGKSIGHDRWICFDLEK